MLFTIFQGAIDALNEKEFQTIKNVCVNRADQADKQLYTSMRSASNSKHLFAALSAPYCNWMCIEFLETIAASYSCIRNSSLLKLIENYSNIIFSKRLREVWDFIPYYSIKDKYYAKLTGIFDDKDPDDLTVEELNRRKPKLAKEIAIHIAVIRIQSLQISWLIPTDKVYQTYLSFLTVPQQLRKDSLVKFGSWIAHLPHCVLQEEHKRFGWFQHTQYNTYMAYVCLCYTVHMCALYRNTVIFYIIDWLLSWTVVEGHKCGFTGWRFVFCWTINYSETKYYFGWS